MATESISAGLSLDAATAFAQLKRDNERLKQRNERLDEQVRALAVLQEIANTVSGETHLPALLRRIAIAALRLTSAQASVVYLVDVGRSQLVARAIETEQSAAEYGVSAAFGELGAEESSTVGDDAAPGSVRSLPFTAGLPGWVATHGALALVADVSSDPRFTRETLMADAPILGVIPRSALAVPLIFKGMVTGVLEVAQTGDEGFDATSLDLMRTLAAQAATAVANAQLYRSLRNERDRIIQTQEDERKRLARDLHDGPAQKLAQIAMSLEFAEQLAQQEPDRVIPELRAIRETALGTSHEIRNLLFDLRPLVLDAESGGLVAALEHFLDRFTSPPSPHMHLQADYPERLSHNAELTVFAIVQEAVNNVLKHANAGNCWIDIRERDDRLVATIRDDGDGFDVRQVQTEYEHRGSWGMLSMLERAALIEARLNIASQPGKGAIVSLEVPR